PVEPSEGFSPSRIRPFRGNMVQRSGQPAYQSLVGALIWPLLSRRRHLTRPQFSHNSFPFIRMLGQVFLANLVKIQASLFDFRVVTRDTVLIDDDRRGRTQ